MVVEAISNSTATSNYYCSARYVAQAIHAAELKLESSMAIHLAPGPQVDTCGEVIFRQRREEVFYLSPVISAVLNFLEEEDHARRNARFGSV